MIIMRAQKQKKAERKIKCTLCLELDPLQRYDVNWQCVEPVYTEQEPSDKLVLSTGGPMLCEMTEDLTRLGQHQGQFPEH